MYLFPWILNLKLIYTSAIRLGSTFSGAASTMFNSISWPDLTVHEILHKILLRKILGPDLAVHEILHEISLCKISQPDLVEHGGYC